MELRYKRFIPKDREAAAELAYQLQWYDRGITTTINQAHLQDNLLIRFPLANHDIMMNEAKRFKLDPALTFAIARQESIFITDAHSGVGALGIMQLMPATASSIAKETKTKYKGKYQLLNPSLNIRLGTAYLKKMHDLYGHPVLATAAYNAGPHRVKQWIPKNGNLAADIWIETIPFYETRQYLKNVLAYTVIYDHNLGITPSLSHRMQVVSNGPMHFAANKLVAKH